MKSHRGSTMPPKRKMAEKSENGGESGKKGRPGLEWGEVRTGGSKFPLVFHLTSPGASGRTKAIGFDIDWTIIATKSGKKFPTGPADWQWWDAKVPEKLRELDAQGFRLVFFTNQGGVEKGKASVAELQAKFSAIVEAMGADVFVFASTGESHFRKPSRQMWALFEEKFNGGVELDLAQCAYVGDAAGRAKDWAPGKPKDFSCSDRMFAANVGVEFKTPEEFFLAKKAVPFKWGSADPAALAAKGGTELPVQARKEKELVVLMGMPASGKSSFFQRHFAAAGYVHVNRDTLNTPAKCIRAAKEALGAGKSAVVDNTNPSAFARAEYVRLAKEAKVPVRLFHLDTSRDVAAHLNLLRQNRTKGSVRRIPDVGYNVYLKNLQPPKEEEGFAELITVPFVPKFEDDEHKSLFMQWTV